MLIFPQGNGGGSKGWLGSIDTVADLPASGNTAGDARVALDTFQVYVWTGSAWQTWSGTGAGAATVGTFDSQTAATNGLVISGTTIYGQSATAAKPGMVNTGAQTFAGAKVFNSTVAVGGALDASSALSVTSTTKGFLPPKMTYAQKLAISSPTVGLEVFDTSTGARNRYNGSGTEYIPGDAEATMGAWLDDSVLQVTTQLYGIQPVADVAGSLAGTYFLLYNNSGTTYYVWLKVGGSGSDPAIAGATGVMVSVATNATAVTIGNAILTAINGLGTAGFQSFDPLGAATASDPGGAEGVQPGYIVFGQNYYGCSAPPPVDGTSGRATGFTFYHSYVVYNKDAVVASNGDTMFVNGWAGNPTFKISCASGVRIYGNNSGSYKANFLWDVDGGGTIGAVGANRPNDIYVKQTITAGGAIAGASLNLGAGSAAAPVLTFSSSIPNTGFYGVNGGLCAAVNGVEVFGIGNVFEMVGLSFVWSTDGGGDIGSASPGPDAGRPNNVYVKQDVTVGRNLTVTGNIVNPTVSGVLTLPAGSGGAPSLVFAGTPADTGFYGNSGGVILQVNGALAFAFGSGLMELGSFNLVWSTDGGGNIGSATPGADSGRPDKAYIKTGIGVGLAGGITASAIAQFDSTTKGLLAPRMTTTQKNAISSPAEGLVVYDTTLHKLAVYTGSAWETVTST